MPYYLRYGVNPTFPMESLLRRDTTRAPMTQRSTQRKYKQINRSLSISKGLDGHNINNNYSITRPIRWLVYRVGDRVRSYILHLGRMRKPTLLRSQNTHGKDFTRFLNRHRRQITRLDMYREEKLDN
jgi:hypothetical protein